MEANLKPIIIYASIGLSCFFIGISLAGESDGFSSNAFGICSVKKIKLHGQLTTYPQEVTYDGQVAASVSSDAVVSQLLDAKDDSSVSSVIIDIDSPGGSMVAGEEIKNALLELGKPSVVHVRSQALSAAYLAALGADYIVASENSDVGSIGVIISYLENSEKNRKEGVNFVEISSGKFKSTGNSNKPLTNEEREILQRDVDILLNNFVGMVSERRKIPVEKVKEVADGSSMLGGAAKEFGLIDKIGGISLVKSYLSEKVGSEVTICEDQYE